MKLKSGSPFWPSATRRLAALPALQQDLRCDVAIIGAGLTGALVGFELVRAGLDVVLLEKRDVGAGSTSASTALVLYEIDTPLVELTKMRGRRAAVRSYECCREAITKLDKITRALPSRCEFRPCPSLYLASENSDLPALKKEFAARKKAGFRVELLARREIENHFPFSAPAGILSADAAELNPLALTRQLVSASIKLGVKAFSKTEVTRTTASRRGASVRTDTGHLVSARWVVVAGGFETKSRVARDILKLRSTFALVTKPIKPFPQWYKRCVIWETSRPYFYLRTTSDNRLMIGGGDVRLCNPRARDRLLPRKRKELLAKLCEFFPSSDLTAASTWAGTFGETKDGLPYIGASKPDSRILYALCYGANGSNFAALASEFLRDKILNRRNPDAKLFGFDR